jgi:hypothetical protein
MELDILMFETIKNLYKKAWDISYNAGSVAYAHATTALGIVIAAISYSDWSPLYSLFGADTGFSVKQGFWTGITIIVSGLAQYFIRTRNTVVTESNKLVPADITLPEVKAAKKNAS